MKAPEKIYLCENPITEEPDYMWYSKRTCEIDIEYTQTDAFIEKACEFWKDHLAGYDIYEDDIERSIESFKSAMKL